MGIVRDLILILIPALLVGISVYYLIKLYLKTENERRLQELKLERLRLTSPLRMQAYERMVLLLERITPSQLILRNIEMGGSAAELQNILIGNIRQEFDHNLSQQLYISSNAWELIKNAREGVITSVNSAASQLGPDASSTDLAQLIFQVEMSSGVSTLYKALEFLKDEARQLF